MTIDEKKLTTTELNTTQKYQCTNLHHSKVIAFCSKWWRREEVGVCISLFRKKFNNTICGQPSLEFQYMKLKWPAIIMYVHSTQSKWPWLSFLSTIKNRWTKKLFQHYCRRPIWPRSPWVLCISVDRATARCLGSHKVQILSGTQILFFVPHSWHTDYFIFTGIIKFKIRNKIAE